MTEKYIYIMDFVQGVDKSQIKGGMMVELKQDMITIKETPKVVLPCFLNSFGTGFEGHAFFEASSIRKINGIYYLVYSSQQRHELCYAKSRYPDKGFVYGGVIISNGNIGYQGRKPEESLGYTGNNHGGLVQINGQWYIFYHRHTQTTQFSR
jgi:arabinoxylan arabinofuranohydrolase